MMKNSLNSLLGALAVTSAIAWSSVAVAQPIALTVNPLSVPAAILSAPFAIFGDQTPATNTAAARAAAVGYTPEGEAIIAAPVLRQVGPNYANPANADYRRPIVIRRGSTVPGFIATARAENLSVPGLAPGVDYDYFVSPERKIVFVDQASRRVVLILR